MSWVYYGPPQKLTLSLWLLERISYYSVRYKFMLRNMLHSGHQTTTKATHPQYNVIADTIGLLKTGNAVTKLFPTSAHN